MPDLTVAIQSLRSERKHLQRLLGRLAADEAKACEAPRLREQGEVLKVQLRAVPPGAERVVLAFPWLPQQPIEVQLQRDLSPQQNVERLFRRARGFEQGLKLIRERQDAALERQLAVEQLLAEVPISPEPDASPDLARERLEHARQWLGRVRALRLRVEVKPAEPTVATRRAERQSGGSLPKGVQQFQSPEGRLVLAGRDARANDWLVTRLLRGRDRWLHVKDLTGAHVVLRCDGKLEPPEFELRACAALCAHLSGVAKGTAADVTLAQGRHVRKVKGSATGSVYVSDERVLRVVVDAAVVDAFYARRAP